MRVRAAGSDVLLDVDVHAGAKRNKFPDGFDAWRKRWRLSVQEPPQRGAANRAICELVAAFFDLRASDVTIEHGALDSRKTLRLRGVPVARVETRLEEAEA